MTWWMHLPLVVWLLWVFVIGLAIGSFLNVLIARLPYEKSPLWPPGSRCFSCYRRLRFWDNVPIIGYLRLRGRCRSCGSRFSSRYLWVEVGVGVAFVGLYVLEILTQSQGGPEFLRPWFDRPGLTHSYTGYASPTPPTTTWLVWAAHAALLSLLVTAAVIDFQHKIIPTHITLTGSLLGLLCSVLMPWPWPTTLPDQRVKLPAAEKWAEPKSGNIPQGVALWPVWGPVPASLPAGSWQHGLVSALAGAVAGQAVGRLVRGLFGAGFRQEAMGLGDADLLMMIGTFLGWQVAVLAMPIGAMLTLPIILAAKAWQSVRPPTAVSADGGVAFGPSIVVGTLALWFGWPAVGESLRVYFFSPFALTFCAVFVGGGLLLAGFVLRREPEDDTVTAG